MPSAKVAPLRLPAGSGSQSGYRNVYLKDRASASGARVYVARVKLGGRLINLPGSQSTLPHVSALFVADWYERKFGAGWPVMARGNHRRRNPWHVWKSAKHGGFLARVWVRGRPREVVELTKSWWPALNVSWRVKTRPPQMPRPKRNARPVVYPTRAAAMAGLRRWVELQWGTTAVMYRTAPAA